MDTAMQHLSEMVEGAAYDKAADLFAEIAREERAVVKLLSIRKWQVMQRIAGGPLAARRSLSCQRLPLSPTCCLCSAPLSPADQAGAFSVHSPGRHPQGDGAAAHDGCRPRG